MRRREFIALLGAMAQSAIWTLLLLGALAFATWAYFARSGPVPLSVEAELSDQRSPAIAWKIGRSSEAFAPSTTHPAHITARRFDIYVWNGTRLMLDIFASAAMKACTTGLQIADEIHLTADDPITLTLGYDNGAVPWRILQYVGSTFFLTAAGLRKEESDAGWSDGFYGRVGIKGNAGGKFEIRAASDNGSPSCPGTFADFEGTIFANMWPPSYQGPGKEGINRITLNAPSGVRRFDDLNFEVASAHQGIAVFAADATDFADQDYVERVELSPKSGTLNFGRQFNVSLVPNVLLEIAFDKSSLGRLNLSSHASPGESPVMKVAGAASDTRLGYENLTPRRIEGFPWWVVRELEVLPRTRRLCVTTCTNVNALPVCGQNCSLFSLGQIARKGTDRDGRQAVGYRYGVGGEDVAEGPRCHRATALPAVIVACTCSSSQNFVRPITLSAGGIFPELCQSTKVDRGMRRDSTASHSSLPPKRPGCG
jgi:hypothetical protein